MSNTSVGNPPGLAPVRSSQLKSTLALVLVISSALGAFGWLWWSAVKRDKINFLPAVTGAEWIIYPKAAEGRIHPNIEVATVFTRSFVLDEVPQDATLMVSGFHRYAVSLNGQALNNLKRRGRSWKEPDLFNPVNNLRRGTNEILVSVSNTNGPPALWLSLKAGNFSLKSDESWEASHAGAAWKFAHLAKRPLPIPVGNGLYGGETPGAAFRSRWPILLLFAAISAAVSFPVIRRKAAKAKAPGSNSNEWLPIALFAALWVGIFVNNVTVLPASLGYDASGHRDYVAYIETNRSLPVAAEGWEMFQPPLYYVICAALLKILFLTVRDSAGVTVLRFFGLLTGIAHCVIVWKSLRLLFPTERARQNWGLLLAAALPPGLFLSHYVSNEALAAVLVSGSVYLCLRILKQEDPSWNIFAGLGLCLGAALLTKSTAVLALPPIFGALVWRAIERRTATFQELQPRKIGVLAAWVRQIVLVAAICLLVSGWHYYRTWSHYGTPLVGVWDPRTGFFWWQDDGYRTAPFYLRFGQVFFHPWFSALHSFADGLYSTLWGDGLVGGSDSLIGPPWNYDLMALTYWLAIVPTLAVLIGAFFVIRNLVRRPSPEWFLILGLGFVIAFAVAYMSMTVPYYCVVKAFYGFSALVPFCALGSWGLERMTRPPDYGGSDEIHLGGSILKRFRASVCSILIGVWALTSLASFWIVRSSVPTLLAKVAALRRENRPLEAQRLLEQRLASDPENRRVRSELANVLLVNKNEEQAAKEAAILLNADPDDSVNLTTLAMALASTHPDRAIEKAEQATKIAPGYAIAYQQLATLRQLQGHYAEGEQATREGLALEPFNPAFYQILGEALVRKGEVSAGISLLKTTCQLRPENAWARSILGEAFELQSQTSDAIAEYTEALRLQPNFPTALNNLAWLRATNPQEQFRNGSEAVRLAEHACQITQYKEPMFIGTLGAAYAEAIRFDDAIKTATQARDLARAAGQKDLVLKNEELIKLFEAHQPYRQAHK